MNGFLERFDDESIQTLAFAAGPDAHPSAKLSLLIFETPPDREILMIVNVSQLYTIDKSALGEKIGALSQDRVAGISAGLKLLLEPRDV